MNLPFSPTFFKKMDIFQQLMEYESLKDKKHLWEGEKAVLIWAASEHHQHLGSAIDTKHVKDALDYCAKEKYITSTTKTSLMSSVAHILNNLAVHEFGEHYSHPAQRNDLKVNKNGVLAGQILTETNNLKDTNKYRKWSRDWWFIYHLAGVLVVLQIIKVIVELIDKFIALPSF